jgi:hypothetical protein
MCDLGRMYEQEWNREAKGQEESDHPVVISTPFPNAISI